MLKIQDKVLMKLYCIFSLNIKFKGLQKHAKRMCIILKQYPTQEEETVCTPGYELPEVGWTVSLYWFLSFNSICLQCYHK